MTELSEERIKQIWQDNKGFGYQDFARALLAADRQARQVPESPVICNCGYEMEQQWVCERCGIRWAV